MEPIKGMNLSGPYNNYAPVDSTTDRQFGRYNHVYFDSHSTKCKNSKSDSKAYPGMYYSLVTKHNQDHFL